MNKPSELMVNWIKALRDPSNHQTTGALCSVDPDGNKSYCCLGVLEEVAGNVAKYPSATNLGSAGNNWEFHGPTAHGETGLPNIELIDLLFEREPTRTDGYPVEGTVYLGLDCYGDSVDAASANDDFGWTFSMIADQLEKVYVNGTGDYNDYRIDELSYLEDGCE